MTRGRRLEYLPSPMEIAQACAAIRARWTPRERRRRYVGAELVGADFIDQSRPTWRPPVIDTSAVRHGSAKPIADLVS